MSTYTIVHITRYAYPSEVTDSANQLILYPKSDDQQHVLEHTIRICPTVNIDYFDDYFSNKVGFFTIVEPHNQLEIRVEMKVSTLPHVFGEQSLSPDEQRLTLRELKWEFPFVDFLQLEHIHSNAEILHVIEQHVDDRCDITETVDALSSFIYKNFSYKQGVTTVESTVDEIWQLKAGVCQDFAHLLITMLRMLGIPSRYISGYICPSSSELRGEGATHAWVEVYIPGLGWKGIDPTNNCWVNERHIKIAYGRDFNDCTPVKGTYKGTSDHILTVSVVIGNEHTKEITHEPTIQPVYTSASPRTAEEKNSYRYFLEMQQQQQ
ncbi:transglutaminase family protein [Sphingobacterium sp. LRF_L2]|uniref:transglutaminase family protein n=1 Tax=Sphingobacterium sp. LRF_L2 TaxID=3369421 RepID=UPI003F62CC82